MIVVYLELVGNPFALGKHLHGDKGNLVVTQVNPPSTTK